MLKRIIYQVIINIFVTFLVLIASIALYQYNISYDNYQIQLLSDKLNEAVALKQWFEVRHALMENGFHIVHSIFILYIVIMTIFEIRLNGFVKKYSSIFVKFETIAIFFRVAIFGCHLLYEIVVIALLCLIIIFEYLIDDFCAKENKKNKIYITYGDLFESRKKTINDIIFEINTATEEPKGILLKGSWGVGKTTFIEIVKDKLYEDDNKHRVIEISAGYSCEPTKLLKEIETQLINLLSEEYPLLGLNRVIKNYFKEACNIINIPSKGIMHPLYDFLGINENKDTSFIEARKEINCLLQRNNLKIIILIDDLERCPSENIKNIFSVLINTLKLTNCITILITDYNELVKAEGIDDEYLNKYFKCALTINEPTFKEMADKIIPNKPFYNEAINFDINYPKMFRTILENYWKLVDAYISKYIKESEKEEYELNFLNNLKKHIYNPRRFERMWSDIEEYVNKVFYLYEENNELYISSLAGRDTVNAVCILAIMKNYFPNIWDEYISAGGWNDFNRNHSEQYEMKNKSEYTAFIQTIKSNTSIDSTLMDLLEMDISNMVDEDYYSSCIEKINNDVIEKDKLEEYIILFSNNKKILPKIGKFIFSNAESIDLDDKLHFCTVFTASLDTGVSEIRMNTNCSVHELMTNIVKEYGIQSTTQYKRILSQEANTAYNECEGNVCSAVNSLLKINIEKLDSFCDWGYSEFVGDTIPSTKFTVNINAFKEHLDKNRFEDLMNKILIGNEPLDLRELDDFMKLLPDYIRGYLGRNKVFIEADSNVLKEYNAIIKHIGRMHNVVLVWLGAEPKGDVTNSILL